MATHGSATTTRTGHRRPLSDITNSTPAIPPPNLRPHRRPNCSPSDHGSSIGSSTPANPRVVGDVYSGTYGGTDLGKREVEQKKSKGKSSARKDKPGDVRRRIAQLESALQGSASRWEAMTLEAIARSTKDEYSRETALPKEYIEKQRAYFREIDAFELAVEVVSDSEMD